MAMGSIAPPHLPDKLQVSGQEISTRRALPVPQTCLSPGTHACRACRVKTLVLDLDDVLVHKEWTRQMGWKIFKRPGVQVGGLQREGRVVAAHGAGWLAHEGTLSVAKVACLAAHKFLRPHTPALAHLPSPHPSSHTCATHAA